MASGDQLNAREADREAPYGLLPIKIYRTS
jgi:hypothetical protein